MHQYELEAIPTPEESREIARKAISILEEFVSDQEQLHDIDLVLTEACSNVARHAYEVCESCNRLGLKIIVIPPEKVIFEVSDWGKGLETDKLDFSMPDPEAVGGRGLYIMSILMDSFDVLKEGPKNTIRLTKYISSEKWIKKA
jgi:serine/threonine-protein kinase RsbW